MPWNDYYQTQLSGIDATDDHSREAWAAILLLLLRAENRLKRRVRSYITDLPLDDLGRFDFRSRDRVRRAFLGVHNAVEAWQPATSYLVAGYRSPQAVPPRVERLPQGPGAEAIRRASDLFAEAWDRGAAILRRDSDRGGEALAPAAEPTRGPRGTGRRGAVTKAAEAETAIEQLARRVARQNRDLQDVTSDWVMNPLRAIWSEGFRLKEQVARLVTSKKTPRDALALLETEDAAGQREQGGPWHMNRSTLRSSFQPHIRAIHRRRTISEAEASGVVHFRAEPPTAWRGRFAPDGILGDHAYRTRTADEWASISERLNRDRRSPGEWSTLGLGFGDVSYLIAVPMVYLAESIASGEAARSKWLK